MAPLQPLAGVRPRLDVIPGGPLIEDLAGSLWALAARGEPTDGAARDAAPLADG